MQEKEYDRELTPQDLAERLQVPVSWVYKQTRTRGPGSMPFHKLGKYCRFNLAEVLEWSAKRAGETSN